MAIFEWVVPADVDISPCPEGCGGLTDDPYGGPCTACWAAVGADSDDLDEVGEG